MSTLAAGMIGFEITPDIDSEMGAWGTTPSMTEIDLPLQGRCLALRGEGEPILWYSMDLFGQTVQGTHTLRGDIARQLGLPIEHIIWTTSQTHSSGAIPGSRLIGNYSAEIRTGGQAFADAQKEKFMGRVIAAGREAISSLRPARIKAGCGLCDSISYNARFPMPTGGAKFTRHHGEGLQSGKYFDTTLGLLEFADENGGLIGTVFNFGCRLATTVNSKYISPDFAGTAREEIERFTGGAPALFAQGFCSDVNCYYFFGTPDHARMTGKRLGEAAKKYLPKSVPLRAAPLRISWAETAIRCREMYTPEEIERHRRARLDFIAELDDDPYATWFDGYNLPEQMTRQDKINGVKAQLAYLDRAEDILKTGKEIPKEMMLTLGGLRIGDVGIFFSPGGNFTATGRDIRSRSPFLMTLIVGETNGIFGYMGPDEEIERGGYETDVAWKVLPDGEFRLAPAKGTVERVLQTAESLLWKLYS